MKKQIILIALIAFLLIIGACSITTETQQAAQKIQQARKQAPETGPVQAEDTSEALAGEAYSNYVSKIPPRDTFISDELNNVDFSEEDVDTLDEESELPADDTEI